MFRRFAVSTLLPLAAFVTIGATDAHAEDVTVAVSYAGLDLSTPSGVAVFRSRVNQAIGAACGSADGRDLAATRHMHECRAELADKMEPRVVAQVGAAQDRFTAAVPSDAPAKQ
jgi:UrcA family protein